MKTGTWIGCGVLLAGFLLPPAASADLSTRRVVIFSDAVTSAANDHSTFYSEIPAFPVPPLDGDGRSWPNPQYDSSTAWAGVACVCIPQPAVAALPVPWTRTVNCDLGTASPTTADWIRPVRGIPPACVNGSGPFVHGDEWYLRREFTLPGTVVGATLWVAVDNMADLYVDGTWVPPHPGTGTFAASGYYAVDTDMYDVTGLLNRDGPHALGFRVYNQDECSWSGVVYLLDVTVRMEATPVPPPDPNCGSVKLVGGVRGYLEPKRGEQATIQVRVCRPGTIRVRIYDAGGELIHEEGRESNALGMDVLRWNLTTPAGKTVTPGIYLVRVDGPGLTFHGKLAVLR